jgi:hypothetical protein
VANHQILSFSTAASAAAVAELDSAKVDDMVGQSPLLGAVLDRVRRVAPD